MLRQRGYTLRAEPEGRIGVAPADRVTPDVVQYIQNNRPALLQQLDTQAARAGGVGTALRNLLPEWLGKSDCGCSDYAATMDRWGIRGCAARRQEIIDHLVYKANQHKGLTYLPTALTQRAAGRLVDKAIRKAQATLDAALPKNGQWFVAVTTAPRQNCDLGQCVASLVEAGWTPTIFAEPDSTHLDGIDLPIIQNDTRLGVWHNWLASVRYGLATGAEYILTVQDDALFHPDSREFTESVMWPSPNTGFISLYTAKHYSFNWRTHNKYAADNLKPPGVNRCQTKSLWGAMALVFHRKTLEAMLEMPFVQNWLGARIRSRHKNAAVRANRKANPHLIQNSDTCIGQALLKLGRDLYFIDPSPVQHISVFSSIGHGGKRNCYRCADHARPLAEQVPVKQPTELMWP